MPIVSNELNAQYWEPVAQGPVAQADITQWAGLPPLPATIAASGNYTSNVVISDGFKVIGVGVTSSQAGSISIQRYLDRAGLVTQGAPITAAITAATPAVANVADGLPFQSFKITISNTGGSVATISNVAVLLNAS